MAHGRKNRLRSIVATLVGIACVDQAVAGPLPVDPSQFGNFENLMNQSTVNTFIRTVGIYADQRPYQPATPLGVLFGFEAVLEVTLMKIPDDFAQAVQEASGSAIALPVLPLPRVQVHKGIGDSLDLGASFVGYEGYVIYGADAKVVLWNDEETPTWAMRLCYSHSDVGFLTTTTWTPQLLMSRKLEFADPYIGIGYEFVSGTLTATTDPTQVAVLQAVGLPNALSGSGGAFMSFLGVGLRIPYLGFKLTIEGSYSPIGADTLGTTFGFSF